MTTLVCGGLASPIAPQNAATAPAEIVILPAGAFEVRNPKRGPGGRFLADADSILAGFKRRGTDLVIDYEHQTQCVDERADGTAPAAGWVNGLRFEPGRGIVGTCNWTERGRRAVAAREYRYLSPVIEADNDGRVVGLRSVALTNTPAIEGSRAIAAKQAADDHVEWDGDAALRREFGGNFQRYSAWKSNAATGNARINGAGGLRALSAAEQPDIVAALQAAGLDVSTATLDDFVKRVGELGPEQREQVAAALTLRRTASASEIRRVATELFGNRQPSSRAENLRGDDIAAKAEFAMSPALQAEFGTAAKYLAFKRADAAGLARVVSRQSA